MTDATATPGNTEDAGRFLAAIRLAETEPEIFDRAFHAMPQYVPWPKAYGGDAIAQAAAAALATVEADRQLHSLHSTFLRPVQPGELVRYEVEQLRDGRGYSTRHVRGYQAGKAVFLTTASFQVPEPGPRRQPTMPDVPAPEELPSSAEALAQLDESAATDYWAHGRSFDVRHVSLPLYTSQTRMPANRNERDAASQGVWVRAFEALPSDARIQQLALAYVCDYTILEPSLRALGLDWSSPTLFTASLDHSMWFHRPARADDWLLFAQESAGVGSGRALGLGRFFTRGGDLVATVMQEGVIRQG
ncbi:acyl-CoA thioesterase II [Microbacterium sp. p3-SID336]|uniref:acyl-CoA thioesterase n=1 Tax=Microbacterium sp. p3-SID336 TaxID=2916212 RepID=UPI0021A729FE|nr:acyl-CoA thioesterase domain-containing protein [Microbacterium sp. p3-SID336]MCT1476832.1 thioesterase family protein [Microbacterium sp. p3-SID336]